MRYEKGAFIIVPNKHKLRELSLGARAIFTEICDFADDSGRCFPSRKLLAARILMHENSVDRFIEELVEKGILEKSGRVRNDGSRTTNEYQILVVPLTTHSEGPLTTHSEAELYPVLTQTSGDKLRIESDPSKEEESRPRSKPKYPHAKEVFAWFPRSEKSWELNVTELKHAELLHERGEERVKKALAFVKNHKDDEYFPKITKPSDLERKWNDLAAYKV